MEIMISEYTHCHFGKSCPVFQPPREAVSYIESLASHAE
jgi:hypothetical protein